MPIYSVSSQAQTQYQFFKTPRTQCQCLKSRRASRGISRTARSLKSICRHGINTDGARRNPETRVLDGEIGSTQHNADRLCGHDGEVLSTREVSQTELDIADNIGVLDVLITLGPVQNGRVVRVVLFTGRLADIVTSREELVVLVRSDPERLAGECSAVVDSAAGLGEQRGAVVVENLVTDGLLSDLVHTVWVDDIPGALGLVAVVCGAFEGCAEGSLLAEESVSVGVFGRADGMIGGDGIALDDGVVDTVDFGVDTEREDVLVVVGVDVGGDLSTVGSGGLGGVHAVGVQHTSELHLELVGTVQSEGVVEAVLVVGGSDDLRDDKLAVTGRDDSTITVIGVLVEKTVVLFVNANSVLNDSGLTVTSGHHTIHVVDGTLAITTQLQGVGHETGTILTNVEGVLLVVRLLGAAVGDNHLNNGDTVEQSALAVLVHVVGANIRDDNTFTVVEANVHLVVGPRQLVATDLEGDTLGLSDVNGLEALVVVLIANKVGKEVVLLQRGSSALAVDEANVNTQNLLLLGIGNNAEIQRVSVLVVELRVTVVNQTLLETAVEAPALIDTNSPGIQENLGHISDTNLVTGANNTGILASNALHDIQILQGESRHGIVDLLVFLNLGLAQVDNDLGDLLSLADDDNGESPAIRGRDLASLERSIFGLAGLTQSDAVELDGLGAAVVTDELSSLGDFLDGKLICAGEC